MISFNKDNKKAKKTETYLSNLYFRSIYDKSGFGIAVTDRKFHFLHVNNALCTMTGYTADKLLSKSLKSILHPEHNSQTDEDFLLNDTSVYNEEKCFLHKNGNELWSELRIIKIRNENREFLHYLCIINDITKYKNTENEYQNQNIKFKALIENSANAIALIDAHGNVLYDSPSYSRIMGYQVENRIGKNTFDIIHPDDKKNIQLLMKNILNNPGCIILPPTRVRHQNGSWLWIDGMANNLLNVKGINAIVINFRDITKNKRTEEALYKAQKLESLGILAGGIAHDFNNLMCGIFGYISIAAETTRDRHASENLIKALNTIERVRSLTGQLLTFSKGGAPDKYCQSLITFIKDTVSFTLSGSQTSCRLDIAEDLWPCKIDKNQMAQALGNIIINAKQAMPDGGIIEVTAVNIAPNKKVNSHLPEGRYVRISVTDHGTGIPKETIPYIFDPFFTTKPKGHGIGLSSCYSIIKRHDGCIEIESEKGKGSTFHIYLPAVTFTEDKPGIRPFTIHKGSGTIMVMDDEKIVRESIKGLLESLGYNVICVENGKKALRIYLSEVKNKRSISGMIFDLTIPGEMGGKDAIKEIRKIDPVIPVFVTSGYADNSIMTNPEDYGFTASICKPFRKAELSEMLKKYIKI